MAVLHGYWEEDREASQGEKEKEEGVRGVQGLLQGVISSFVGKQEVATLAPAQDTQEVAAYWKKKKEDFAENPLGFGGFQGKKLHTL
jgi:hypothetical protein